ncbi:MAG: MFS transporter, partial [Rhodospirillales bacterium]|nr:MFS transporter [Rhodospirillales bacterium]
TGFVFHQVFITEAKGWSLTVWAGAFILFAFSSMASSLFFGPLVDRLSALRVMPFILIPLAIVLPLLALFDHTAIIFVFMAGMGATLGGTITIFGAVWPEIWGTTNLGAIRSVGQAFTVFASALAPWVFGLLIDGGMGVAGLAWMNLAHTGIASLLAFLPWFVGTQARDQA